MSISPKNYCLDTGEILARECHGLRWISLTIGSYYLIHDNYKIFLDRIVFPPFCYLNFDKLYTLSVSSAYRTEICKANIGGFKDTFVGDLLVPICSRLAV